ncbi:hypothetical protein Tco_0471409 [Tanacetum coccineum]
MFDRMESVRCLLYPEHVTLLLQLPRIPIGECKLDLVVIGLGPAGLALAAESAKPDLIFTNNYGVWEDEFIGLGLDGCIEHVWRDTLVYLDDNHPILIGRAYGRVSRDLLNEELLRRISASIKGYCSLDLLIQKEDAKMIVDKDSQVVLCSRLKLKTSADLQAVMYMCIPEPLCATLAHSKLLFEQENASRRKGKVKAIQDAVLRLIGNDLSFPYTKNGMIGRH